MGKIHHILAYADVHPDRWPYSGRFVIENCETVHLHLNNLRLEFTRDQFADFASVVTAAAQELKGIEQ